MVQHAVRMEDTKYWWECLNGRHHVGDLEEDGRNRKCIG